MKVYKTMLAIEGDAALLIADTIEHGGKFWIVTQWLDSPDRLWSSPKRIICLTQLPHHKGRAGHFDFLLDHPIPRAIWDGRVPRRLKAVYMVMENPGIIFPRRLH